MAEWANEGLWGKNKMRSRRRVYWRPEDYRRRSSSRHKADAREVCNGTTVKRPLTSQTIVKTSSTPKYTECFWLGSGLFRDLKESTTIVCPLPGYSYAGSFKCANRPLSLGGFSKGVFLAIVNECVFRAWSLDISRFHGKASTSLVQDTPQMVKMTSRRTVLALKNWPRTTEPSLILTGRWMVVEILRYVSFVLMFASMYKFLITGYQNLLVLVDSGTGSAQVMTKQSTLYPHNFLLFIISLSMAAYVLVRWEFGVGEIVTIVDDDIEPIAYTELGQDTKEPTMLSVLSRSSLLTIAVYITFVYLPETFVSIGLTLLIAKSVFPFNTFTTFVNSFFAVLYPRIHPKKTHNGPFKPKSYRLNSRDYIQDKLGAEATVQQNSASQMERVTVSINDFIESKPVFAPFQGSGYNPSPIPETFETFELKQSKISADFETREPRKRWSSWDSKNLSRGGD
ncbi:hypothetical protein K435DRAFT_801037 [Dendrothele bispora CBS 962.96]|uniref:Uncharacterized protein n=1 Tax=Dendrothele bispora (strain CBS 962.96) TaxID=1314807 RepID=A0A4S8LQH3_DENBC|nr:hypothetical protein K435DRAFT_801037 [Dendrothele bispora CBS 962.96]